MLQWFIRSVGHLIDGIITVVFAVPTLWKFSEWAEKGFSWLVAAQIAAIVSAWLLVIAFIVVKQEVKRQREQGGTEMVVFSFEHEKP